MHCFFMWALRIVDCQWNTWGWWGDCSKTCGVGQREQIRTKRVTENSSGSCSGLPSRYESCQGDHACPGNSSIG